MSAGHRERARKINNLPAIGRKGTSRPQPSCFEVCPFVSWFNSFLMEKSFYPGRPRGGLTIVPSRHLQQVPTIARSNGFYKSAPPRTHPSCPPLLGPMPSGAYVVSMSFHPAHKLRVRMRPEWLYHQADVSTHARPLGSCPVSLFVLGGLSVPPPLCSKARRPLRPRPNK